MAKVWDVESGKELFRLKEQHGPIWSAAFSHNGRRIVTGSHGLSATVWDATTAKSRSRLMGIPSIFMRPCFPRTTLGFSRAARIIRRSSGIAATGKELLTFKGHSDWVFSAAFSPDGQRIVTGSGDDTIKVWEAATGEQVAKWQEEERTAAAVEPAPGNPR